MTNDEATTVKTDPSHERELLAAVRRIEKHAAVSAHWTTQIGWIVVVWAVASVLVGAWMGTVLLSEVRAERAAESASSGL
jgi:hypothetical protein